MNLRSMWMRWIIGGTVALALVVGTLAVWSTTSAAPNTTAAYGPAGVATERSLARPGFGDRMGGGLHSELYETQLASELGITVEELRAAQQAAHEAVIQQLVADGTMTQEQADLMIAASRLRNYIDADALKAEALGITVDELQAARDAGQTLSELLEAQGMDYTTYRENLVAACEAAVNQAVADGVITADQAEQLQNGRLPGRGDGPGRGPRNPGGSDL